ncbi:hypothetical protein HDV62DRAFT_286992 [Trichoderma sp. SZMC 28011]
MHTIEISAHARITLPCLALHAPLPPPAPWYELITRLLPAFLPALPYQIRRPILLPAAAIGHIFFLPLLHPRHYMSCNSALQPQSHT